VPGREAAREIVRCCRSGLLKSVLRSEDLVGVDLAGTHHKGSRQATTELDLQLPEIALLMGEVPCVPYATAGSPALGDAVEPFLAT
jgi:ribulose-5-phosphate 4-epimerase/fuculose-1-phosphate aldolase